MSKTNEKEDQTNFTRRTGQNTIRSRPDIPFRQAKDAHFANGREIGKQRGLGTTIGDNSQKNHKSTTSGSMGKKERSKSKLGEKITGVRKKTGGELGG